MTTTYFLMLLFVFWTCYRIGMAFSTFSNVDKKYPRAVLWVNLLYASAGTLFFHNVW